MVVVDGPGSIVWHGLTRDRHSFVLCVMIHMRSLFIWVLILLHAGLLAQSTPPAGARIEILSADNLVYDKAFTKAQRLLGHVRLKHENALMRCDSAWLFEDQTMNAFGHVAIDHDTLHITGERLDYVGKERLATITGAVRLSDPGMELATDALTYALRERTARYTSGAVIISHRENNTLTSRNGAYQAAIHRFVFSDSVKLSHPEHIIVTDTLHYTTTTGVADFFGPTRIIQGATLMFCERGSYDTRADRGLFTRAGRILDGAQELRGDSLLFDGRAGEGRGWGHVTMIDTSSNLLVRGQQGLHLQHADSSYITGRAELVMLMGEDSLFLHADTLFATTDSSRGQRVLARRNVRFFKNDMQGVCDTMTWADRDSLITLAGSPYLWSGKDQISGRLITIALRNGHAHRLHVLRDALLANSVDSLPEDADPTAAYFDQVTGTTITGWFAHDKLVRIEAEGNSRTVSFAKEKDESGTERVTTMNRADCSRIVVRLDSGEVSSISFLVKPDAVMYPIGQAPVEEMRMKGFTWNAAARPVDRISIFAPEE